MQSNTHSKFLLTTLITIFVISFLYTLNPQSAKAEDWLTGWSYRKKITIDHSNVDADITDFPLLVKITEDSDISTALSNGYDIRFTTQDGTTLLSYERESWQGGNGSQVTAVIWVKVPSISATTNTDIYMYYGKSDATDGQDTNNVWDSNFKGVWHLLNGNDSTINSNNGAVRSGIISTNDVKIVSGYIFPGVATSTISTNYTPTGSVHTAGAWVNFSDITSWHSLLGVHDAANHRMFIDQSAGGASLSVGLGNKYQTINLESPLVTGQWYYISATGNGSTGNLYVNGNRVGNSFSYSQTGNNADELIIGARTYWGAWQGYFSGVIDEIRYSNIARSAEWIKFEYNNINELDNELSFSSQQDTTPPVLSNFFPQEGTNVTNSTPTITFTTNENATCRISYNVDESYQDMSDDITCQGSGTTSQSCITPDLGIDQGRKNLYISCTDGLNQDTINTNKDLFYILDTSVSIGGLVGNVTQSLNNSQNIQTQSVTEILPIPEFLIDMPLAQEQERKQASINEIKAKLAQLITQLITLLQQQVKNNL